MENPDQDLDKEYHSLLNREAESDALIDAIERRIQYFSIAGWVCVFLGFIFFFTGLYVYFFLNHNMEDLNLLGDFYGGSVASLWSLAALLFIFVAFLGQKQQLINQQREVRYNQFELKATRLELLRQREQLQEQNATLRQQRFENTFFQLMNMHNSIVNDMDIVSEGMENETGSDCFHIIYHEFRRSVKLSFPSTEWESREVMERAWLDFYKRYESEIGHYIRNLYHILKFVNQSQLDNATVYSKFVRSSLSSDELLVLFYNCHTMLGRDKFKPLIEKFNLFKNMPTDELISTSHLLFYDKQAFDD